MSEPSVVLFDGFCNLCNGSVQFIIDRDPREQFRFASLQSEVGQELLRKHGLSEDCNTIVLIENSKAYVRSTAALRIAQHLRWPWPLFYVAIAIPGFLRDAVYRLIAANRYRMFGKQETCRIPTPELRRRFLDS